MFVLFENTLVYPMLIWFGFIENLPLPLALLFVGYRVLQFFQITLGIIEVLSLRILIR